MTKKTDQVKPFLAMDVLEEAQQLQRRGEHIIHFELGEPDFATPSCVIEAVKEALDKGMTHYTTSMGLLELREAICRDYHQSYGVYIDPEQVVVTDGSSPALLLIFASLLEPGDHILLSDPYYACYPNIIKFFGGKTTFFPLHEEEGYLYNPEIMTSKCTDKTKAILINSPSNPTGRVQPEAILKTIAGMSPYIISDEIYHGLSYGVKEHSILEYTDRAFVLNGFSKRYAMTGWRLGYAILPKEFIQPVKKLQQNFFISANAFVQWAGLIALQKSKPDTELMRQEYDRRRQFVIPALREAGFKINYEPDGAYYALMNIKAYSSDSIGFANQILHHAGIALTPGVDFGKTTEGYLRISYANSMENLIEGVSRLKEYIKTLTP